MRDALRETQTMVRYRRECLFIISKVESRQSHVRQNVHFLQNVCKTAHALPFIPSECFRVRRKLPDPPNMASQGG